MYERVGGKETHHWEAIFGFGGTSVATILPVPILSIHIDDLLQSLEFAEL